MCTFCEPRGWYRKCCNFCGAGSEAYISISIAIPHGGEFPYSTTDLCKSCFDKYGLDAAIQHNEECRSDFFVTKDYK